MKANEVNREVADGTLRMRHEGAGPGGTLVVAGELDLANAGTLERELERLTDNGVENVKLDLRELEFIDSTGIAVLVAAHRRLAERDSRMQLIRSRAPAVRRVIEITGLEAELAFVDAADGAAPDAETPL